MNEQRPNRPVDTFPLAPILVLFVGVTVILALVGLLTPQSQEVAAAPTSAFVMPSPPALPTRTPTPVPPTATPAPPTATLDPQAAQQVAAASAALDPQMISNGERTYQSICAACHGFNARGVAGLGKSLIGSEFINTLSDEELHAFLIVGRGIDDPLNTTGVMMPARGGNPSLTDADLNNVIAFIRSINVAVVAGAPTVAVTPAPTESGPRPTATPWTAPQLGSSSGQEVAAVNTPASATTSGSFFGGDAQLLYLRSCSACHGLEGEGVPYLAGSLADSSLLRARDGAGMLAFLSRKQPPVDPRMAYPHPYRGGYPALSDQDILSLVTYLYTLPAANS